MSELLLQLQDLHVHYGVIHALQGINMNIERGTIVTLIGGNGAGKSTTLRAVSGLLRPTHGSILFEGQPIHQLAAHRIVRRGIAHAPEGRGIFPNLSVEENLMLGAYARNDREGIRSDRTKSLALFPRLAERLRQRAGTLSGGEQQMLAIARALMARPRLLLLDEPSLGLAPQIVQVIFRIIRQINAEGVTILLVEQNAHMALSIADQAYVIQTGKVIKHGPARELLTDKDIQKAYLGG
ncbi:MAG: ABC transporter ATP-binding protein [Phycisphaerae bacterium]|jgi:branched-chain amino acid transport system ATP-binding protein|nr:MAG: ABC transporter ATP-binding protein [Phycisphaerae bacterium]